MIQEDRKSFIEELRSLDVPTKRNVLIVSVAVSMIVIVYLWLIYFNGIVSNATPVAAQSTGTVSAPTAEGTGVLGLFAVAMASFWQAIRNGAGEVLGSVGNARQYNISPK
jgi:hypothetical protein